MINFTVGPVQSNEEVRAIGSENVPYFRTPEFSKIMIENERLFLEFSEAEQNSKAVFITGSGTASMEAVVMNMLTENDNVLVINGGSFGKRFIELLDIHDITFSEIKLEPGQDVTDDKLLPYEGKGYSAFLINVHETSTGVRYDMELVADFCRRNKLFLIVDAISSFLADEFSMKKYNAGVMITGSQKALACPPGVSVIILSPEAVKRVEGNNPKCMYFDLKEALKNQERGQTPFTPAVSVLLQINARLREIKNNGGVHSEIEKIAALAGYFRNKIKNLPFEYISKSMSNAVTALHPVSAPAYDIFTILKDEYGIWVCPNGGELRDSVFRVGHIGNLRKEDYDILIDSFKDLQKKGII
ncbi:MAG: aminotransferase class V-fold PLP-dependent enzyme [Lachnospiraceae bacterium]|nr:aminotransferase class V-fold PLP-dependent enzyme [Lachnospiraceae bacterium]